MGRSAVLPEGPASGSSVCVLREPSVRACVLFGGGCEALEGRGRGVWVDGGLG